MLTSSIVNHFLALCLILILTVTINVAQKNITIVIGKEKETNGTISCPNFNEKNFSILNGSLIYYPVIREIDAGPCYYSISECNSTIQKNGVVAFVNHFEYHLATIIPKLNIPYLVSGEHTDTIANRHIYWIDSMYIDLAKATLSLIRAAKTTEHLTIIFDTSYRHLAVYERELESLFVPTFMMEYNKEISDGNLARAFRLSKPQYTDTQTFIILMNNDHLDLMTPIFDTAYHQGLMNLQQLWIIPSLYVQPSQLEFVRFSNTRIVTFGLDVKNRSLYTNDSMIRTALCEDAVMHIASAKVAHGGSIDLSDSVTQHQSLGQMGVYGLNRTGTRIGGRLQYLAPCNNNNSTPCESLRQVGIWSSTNSSATIFDYKISRKNIIIKLGVVIQKPIFTETHGVYNGYFHSLMSTIAAKYNWTLKWVIVKSNTTDGTDTDLLIKKLFSKEVDIAVSYLRYTDNRYHAGMAFSQPLFYYGYQSLALKKASEIEWLLFVYPFGVWIWAALAIIFLLYVLVLFFVDRLTPKSLRKNQREPYSLGESCFNILITFTITKWPVRPLTFSARLFMTLVWATVLIIVASFTANLTPFLMKKETKVPTYDKFSTLVNNTDGLRWFFSEPEGYQIMLNSSNKVIRELALKPRRLWPNAMFQASKDAINFLKTNSSWIYITDETHASYMSKKDCSLASGSDVQLRMAAHLGFLNTSKYISQVNTTLTEMSTSGALEALYLTWIQTGRPCTTSAALTLEMVTPLFIVLGGGIIISVFIALIEAVFAGCKICVMRMKLPKLVFGHVYNAQVDEILKDGVKATIADRPHKYFLHNSQLHPNPIKNMTAISLGFKEGSKFKVKYFGRDPISKAKRFTRHMETAM